MTENQVVVASTIMSQDDKMRDSIFSTMKKEYLEEKNNELTDVQKV